MDTKKEVRLERGPTGRPWERAYGTFPWKYTPTRSGFWPPIRVNHTHDARRMAHGKEIDIETTSNLQSRSPHQQHKHFRMIPQLHNYPPPIQQHQYQL